MVLRLDAAVRGPFPEMSGSYATTKHLCQRIDPDTSKDFLQVIL
ncbi:hypothetical protein SAMN06298212_1097 [Ruaniaceae bacterium KH17]|nr:hypothetical protein SAMN06298212_1097 [Ruaniaceae bacterium KH17]